MRGSVAMPPNTAPWLSVFCAKAALSANPPAVRQPNTRSPNHPCLRVLFVPPAIQQQLAVLELESIPRSTISAPRSSIHPLSFERVSGKWGGKISPLWLAESGESSTFSSVAKDRRSLAGSGWRLRRPGHAWTGRTVHGLNSTAFDPRCATCPHFQGHIRLQERSCDLFSTTRSKPRGNR